MQIDVLWCQQDLRELDRLHGRSDLCLRLKFKRGLHPFFPPQVQLLRPRFLGAVPGAVASHPMLQLAKWDPWRSQRNLLKELRQFLEVCPKLSHNVERNHDCWPIFNEVMVYIQ